MLTIDFARLPCSIHAETSLESVAQACGISRTTLFSYFPAKSEILLYGDERNVERVSALLHDAPFDLPVGVVLRKAARTMRPVPAKAREELAVYWRILDENSDVAAQARAMGQRYARIIADFVAVRLGTEPSDSMPALLGETVPAALLAAARHWTVHAEPGVPLEEALENAVDPLITAYLGTL